MIGIEFLPIKTQGRIDNYKEPMTELMYEIGDMYAQLASSQPYEDPWIGYFARVSFLMAISRFKAALLSG